MVFVIMRLVAAVAAVAMGGSGAEGADGRWGRYGATARRALTPDDGRRQGRASSSAEASRDRNNCGGDECYLLKNKGTSVVEVGRPLIRG
jgi:hypothetical protein